MVFKPRRTTVTAMVGNVAVGSAQPIVVQSMTNTDTADAVGTAAQIAALATAGSQLVRITVNNDEAAAAVPKSCNVALTWAARCRSLATSTTTGICCW